MSQEVRQQKIQILKNDLLSFSKNILKIRDELGLLIPLSFQYTQLKFHQKCEEQLKRIGRIRLVVPKSRKNYISTYVAARYFQKTIFNEGMSTYILSHQSDTTDILFEMVKRFYENLPEGLKNEIPLESNNKKQLVFESIDSRYRVGTANNATVGRGMTPLLFHGSEVAFWEKTDEIIAGILSAIPDKQGTQIILESTGNGQSGLFWDKTQEALDNSTHSDYEVFFLPWFWKPDNYRDIPPSSDFLLNDEEIELKRLYNLVDEQLYWYRIKKSEYGNRTWVFHQEFPTKLNDCFQSTNNNLVDSSLTEKASKNSIYIPNNHPVIMGVDPGRRRDPTAICIRKGPEIIKVFSFFNTNYMVIVDELMVYIDKYKISKVFVDYGEGNAIIDRFHYINSAFKKIVVGVFFKSTPTRRDLYKDKRTEMACEFAKWMEGNVRIPNDQKLISEINIIPDVERRDQGLFKLPSKDKIKEKLKRSTDLFDSIILTFAYHVKNDTLNLSNSHMVNSIRVIDGSPNNEDVFKNSNRNNQHAVNF